MKNKKILYGSIAALSILAAGRTLSARTPTKKSRKKLPSYDHVDAYVIEQMQRLRIPGASLAIIEGNEITHMRGFGQAYPGGEEPASQTPFFIGSLTKSITALAIMQLVEAGKVELDAPIQRYLPWFRVADFDASARMTVRHLLNQTSGLSFLASNLILAELDDRPGATERQVRGMATLKLHHPVGETVEYCNLNYNVLGLIIEAASGEAYAEYIQRHIFDPLDMGHTYAEKAAAEKDGLAVGHRHWFGYPVPARDLPIPLGSLPSGQLISCAEDMAHYLIAHMNGGKYGKEEVLSAGGMDELHRGEKEYFAFGNSVGSYAMGWFDQKIGSTRIISHGGNVPDFSAYMALIPDQQKGLALLLNADPYGLPMITDEIGSNLAAVLAGQQPPPIKLDFIQWIFRLLPLLPLLQLWGVITTFRKLRSWKRNPETRPVGGKLWFQHILLPLIPDLSLAAIMAYLRTSRLLNYLQLFNPDLALIVQVSGWLASTWASLRTRLVIQTLRKVDR